MIYRLKEAPAFTDEKPFARPVRYLSRGPLVLLIDDNRVDAVDLRHALKDLSIDVPLHVISQPQTAISWLSARKSWHVSLIILEIELKDCDGLEILRRIKEDELLNQIPVIVLTRRRENSFRDRCLTLGASAYLRKGGDYSMLVKRLRMVLKELSFPFKPQVRSNVPTNDRQFLEE